MRKKRVIIISPASSNANNGNWQTASRWRRFLHGQYQVRISQEWDGEENADVMIALHARRSAASISRWSQRMPAAPLLVALTGTDLYRDISSDHDAQLSLQLASMLIVLQEDGLHALSMDLRNKTQVLYQSARSLKPVQRETSAGSGPRLPRFPVIMIGHLRAEKMPQTFMQAAALVTAPTAQLLHVGDALDASLGELARKTADTHSRYQWLGPLAHGATRQLLKRCGVMVIASAMEGGANVIIEAVTSGVPVLASDISGNRGMLGTGYAGYFPVGDSGALARLIDRVISEPDFLAQLHQQCAARAALFTPEREQTGLLQLMDNALNPT